MNTEKELTINGIVYVPKTENAPTFDNMPFVLIRGYSSGVQYGFLKSRSGSEVELVNSRRIWSWSSATETSQIAVDGIDAKNSKVTLVCPMKIITDVIEVLFITANGADNLINQPVWKK